MANNWFEFKQFRIVQERSAMKVGTDGVLLGVCIPNGIYTHILDVGTGTGLVALMMAQRFATASIDAIEIDKEAAGEAAFNFSESPWENRLNVIHADARKFTVSKKYNLIVSNPPYFIQSLKNQCRRKSTARHAETLAIDDLFKLAANLLEPNGYFVVILPYDLLQPALSKAKQEYLNTHKIISIKPRADKNHKRVIIILSFLSAETIQHEELTIESSIRHHYTDQFKSLTNQFYFDN